MSEAERTVIVAIPFTQDQQETIRNASPTSTFVFSGTDTADDGDIAQADIVMGNLPPQQLVKATHLRWVQLASAGADSYSAPGVLPEDVLLTNSVGAYGHAVSEHVFAMTLSLIKKLPLYRDNQKARTWHDEGVVTSLKDAHVLVLGLGDIGRRYAEMASALGAHVTGMRRHVGEPPRGVEKVINNSGLATVLPQMDIVVSFLPGGAQTRHLVNADFLDRLHDGAYLLNGGRGTVVDPEALYQALESGKLAGAGLDVTEPEPLPADSPLWKMPNVLITPHVAGGYHLPDVLDAVAHICASNLAAYCAGQPLRNVVRR
ncbi:MAG: D-2-hydroxyacid dehydrogenase [Bifidobacteriaceae bacterium]|jgi:phosphoglycerate dehydrogenase-like enzyme|nr:D-2-hydroxyacid dehydrogenase [Bifidobacteriaceae bacterium]MCI1978573.1 D-2-hydroxyacid dehydrogenase [Bifidobacteriaceae bacterium]